MKRNILAGMLIILVIELLLIIPVIYLTPVGPKAISYFTSTPTPTPLPILTPNGPPPTLTAKAAYLLDEDTGRTLADLNAQQQLPMASTTKIMTAVIALEQPNPSELVTVKQDAVDEVKNNDGSSAQLVVGDQIPLKYMLYGLMLPSGDDAAIAIADTISGSPANFVTLMNTYARKLHLTHTHYINPDGLTYDLSNGKPNPNHYTSAQDLTKLTQYAMKNPRFAQLVELQQFNLAANGQHHAYTWANTDNLLSEYAGALGVKTGYTPEAGYCLVFAANNGAHRLIGVVLGEKVEDQRFVDAINLLNWGFGLPMRPPPPTPTPKK
jgi:serine-type D-Ala-D-Ala carboxypeptidase (penicillin-binding protein 5/6)